ncbi:hypothetical protein CHARACLAT_029991 [Characodon lateralis]|uniref:Uncharacterized protein n=1 Tax=Characodon lateralis TaxID=208331 RepID=A0ABU7DN57_9TELE|nr:hypothetical protein [Characodon lateralis]
MIWGTMRSADFGPLTFIKSKVSTAIFLEVSEPFPLLTSFVKKPLSFSCSFWPLLRLPQAPIPGLITSKLARPTVNPRENLRDTRASNADELKSAIKATWAS